MGPNCQIRMTVRTIPTLIEYDKTVRDLPASAKGGLLLGEERIAMRDRNGFVLAELIRSKRLVLALFPGIPCVFFSPRSIVTSTPPAARPCARASCLRLLAARGSDCRVLTTGILDPERETSLDEVLAALELPARRFQVELKRGGTAEVIDLSVKGVRVTLILTVSSRAERSPDSREAAIFLELAEQVFDRFRPDVLLTYGGHPASLELMRRARATGDCRRLPLAQFRL